jgi:hypothetical protein
MTDAIKSIIEPRKIQFDGFPIARSLPRIGLKSVGPWLFFDHMGPHDFEAGQGLDVPPHPHINLATVTYLFEGEIIHRDSIGNVQNITPGAINLMVAGRGIAHSERSPEALRQVSHSVHGLQLWQALPVEEEETTATFHHYPLEGIPVITQHGVQKRLLIGEAFGQKSPVNTFTQTLFAEYYLQAEQSAVIPKGVEELAVYAVDSKLRVNNEILPPRCLAILTTQSRQIHADNATRVVFIGGLALGKRYMWWNFVSSRKERIHEAMNDWKQKRFGNVYDDNGTPANLPETDSYSLMSD